MTEISPLHTLTADIVSAFVSNNPIQAAQVPDLVLGVYSALTGLGAPATPEVEQNEKATPAQIRKSVTQDALISFEDGKCYKTLKRHLTLRGLDPAGYRAKWGLPADYPMVAPSYSEARSKLAQTMGLGRKAAAPEPVAEPEKKKPSKKKAEAPEAPAEEPAPEAEMV